MDHFKQMQTIRPLLLSIAIFSLLLVNLLLISKILEKRETSEINELSLKINNINIVNDYSKSLINLKRQYASASPSHKIDILKLMITKSQARKKIMISLIKANPKNFALAAMPSNLRSSFPKEVQINIEAHSKLKGKFEITIADNFNEKKSTTEFTFISKGISYKTYFTDNSSQKLTSAKASASGITLDKNLVLENSNLKLTNIALMQNTKEIAVILVNFNQNPSEPWTKTTIESTTFTGSPSVNTFYQEISFGNINLAGHSQEYGDIFGWYTMPSSVSNTVCDPDTWAFYAQTLAAKNGFYENNYDNIIYALPKVSACPWLGLGSVGGNPGYLFVNGSYNLQVVAHELGHNFGAWHANGYYCQDTAGNKVPISNNCTVQDYVDPFDIMGNISTKHMNAFFKSDIGWLTPDNIKFVNASGSYTIAPLEKSTNSYQVLAIPRLINGNGNITQYYYIDFRQPFGFDSFSTSDPDVNGVQIRIAPQSSDYRHSLLIDASPGSSIYDSSLTLNQTFTDSANHVSIKTINITPSQATIYVTLANLPCYHADPEIKVIPSSGPAVVPGTPVNFDVTVTNNDSAACSGSSYSLESTLPTGWIANYSPSTFTLLPQESISSTLTITSPLSAYDGSNYINVLAKNLNNQGYNNTKTIIYWVDSALNTPLLITKSISNANPKSGDEVTYTITITNNSLSELTNLVTTDMVSPQTIYVPGSAETNNGNFNEDTNVITWQTPSLASKNESGNSISYSFRVVIK